MLWSSAPKVSGEPSLSDMLTLYQFDNDFMGHATSAFPYPGERKWNGMKRIFAILNLDKKNIMLLWFFSLMSKG